MSDPVLPLMELRDVRFGYHRTTTVIHDVTVPVQAGRLLALIGPNASGKTTLLKLMLGLLRPWRGQITVDGQSVRRFTGSQRAAIISYVPQRSSVGFAFSVRQVVELGRYAMAADESAVAQALQDCELTDLADRPFTELSVGQQQRVLLARAIAQSTGGGRIMLLDEPTSALDLAHVHRVMTHLRRLATDGLTVVVVMHDLNLAARYADDVWLMNDGEIAACGAWDVVLTPPVLEPVYGVSIRALGAGGDDHTGSPSSSRPIFDVRLPSSADSA